MVAKIPAPPSLSCTRGNGFISPPIPKSRGSAPKLQRDGGRGLRELPERDASQIKHIIRTRNGAGLFSVLICFLAANHFGRQSLGETPITYPRKGNKVPLNEDTLRHRLDLNAICEGPKPLHAMREPVNQIEEAHRDRSSLARFSPFLKHRPHSAHSGDCLPVWWSSAH